MVPLDYYLWGYMKILVYEMKLQMVAQLIGHISDAAPQIRYVVMPCHAMPCTATTPLSQTARTFLR
jgi:hypothetical protein